MHAHLLVNSMKAILFSLLMIHTVLYAGDPDFQDLLLCNLSHIDVASRCSVEQEMRLYKNALNDESNYAPVPTLEAWIDPGMAYPNIHPTHRIVLDIIKELPLSTIAEIGAGAGKVSKYIYAENPSLKITCIEHNSRHLQEMHENFQTRSAVIVPDIQVKASLIKGGLPDLSFLESNAFDLVFTCTVMMHLPFIPAIQSALEIKRLSARYILHVENKNDGKSWYNMTIVNAPSMSPINLLGIDYVKLYESLGVKTLKYFEYKDPFSPATFIVYLGEKN